MVPLKSLSDQVFEFMFIIKIFFSIVELYLVTRALPLQEKLSELRILKTQKNGNIFQLYIRYICIEYHLNLRLQSL